jgi:hypothetical protein
MQLPKRSWFSSLFNFKSESQAFLTNQQQTLTECVYNVKVFLGDMKAVVTEKNPNLMKCTIEKEGKPVKFKVEVEEIQSCCKVTVTFHTGSLEAYRSIVEVFTGLSVEYLQPCK